MVLYERIETNKKAGSNTSQSTELACRYIKIKSVTLSKLPLL